MEEGRSYHTRPSAFAKATADKPGTRSAELTVEAFSRGDFGLRCFESPL